ncbi:MAG: hypothetical protein ACREGC_03260, partial [Minisyncoccia bacterium]
MKDWDTCKIPDDPCKLVTAIASRKPCLILPTHIPQTQPLSFQFDEHWSHQKSCFFGVVQQAQK